MAESKPNPKQLIEDRARALAEPLMLVEGLELVDLEFLKEPGIGWVLRLFIDKPGGKVGVEECTAASNALNPALDVEDFIPHEYSLEVSSPGINRPLKKKAHYEQVVGQKVRVKTFGPVGEPPRKNFVGVLKAVQGEAVQVEVDGGAAFSIPIKDIAKANLEFEF